MNRFVIPLMTVLLLAGTPRAQESEKEKAMEIYGHIMLDAGYNFNQIHPDWFDALRPTQLPAFKDEFAPGGNTYFSVRQTKLGFKNYFKTGLGELQTLLEFDFFGTGTDAGQTTLVLQQAYAELGKFGIGQTWSPFMDIDVFPNTLEYWGPNGMVFFRNIQVRYMPIQGDSRLTIALERPGASADRGVYANRIQLLAVKPKFPLPDLSAEYRYAGDWGYVELAGIIRYIKWEDQRPGLTDLSGEATGWGLNLSTNINFGKALFHGQLVYGKGIENYMDDAPVDIGVKNNFSNPAKPVIGVALPVLGIVAFVDYNYSDKVSTSIGYALVDIENADGQTDDTFKKGQYAIGNILYSPTTNVTTGIEFQWGDRENFRDGWSTSISKIQVSFKYTFNQNIYRN